MAIVSKWRRNISINSIDSLRPLSRTAAAASMALSVISLHPPPAGNQPDSRLDKAHVKLRMGLPRRRVQADLGPTSQA